MSECTLIVAAHPDNDVLGCGGLIARAADRGEEVRIAIPVEGLTSRAETRDIDTPADLGIAEARFPALSARNGE